MKAIIEFLKPNWWKVGIVIIMIFLYFTVEIGIETVVVGKAPEVIINKEVVVYQPVTKTYFNPIIYPFVNYFVSNQSSIISRFGFLYLIVVFIYWYLLACLIYFIITKIKRLIGK